MAAANDIIFDAHDIAASNIESAARSTLPSSPQAAAQFTDTEKMHVYEKLFDDPEISHGVMDLSNIPCNQVGCLHSFTHLINLRSTTGWGPTVFQNIQVLNVSHNGLNGGDLSPLCRALSNQDLNLTPTMHKNLILPVDLKTVYPF